MQKLPSSLAELRPRLLTAYVTYIELEPNLARPLDSNPRYRFSLAESADDQIMDFIPRWQRNLAAVPMSRGEWACLIAHDTELDDLRVGHVWTAFASTTGFGNGMLNVALRYDEAYVWDLYIHPDHRRESLGNAMGQALIDTFEPKGVKWGYTHVLTDNSSSIIWHHMFGFNVLQVVNCVHLGNRYWWKIPFAAAPRFGPLTRKGRHSTDPPPDPMGPGLLPPEWARSKRD